MGEQLARGGTRPLLAAKLKWRSYSFAPPWDGNGNETGVGQAGWVTRGGKGGEVFLQVAGPDEQGDRESAQTSCVARRLSANETCLDMWRDLHLHTKFHPLALFSTFLDASFANLFIFISRLF